MIEKKAFPASKKAEAILLKEKVGGILERIVHPTMGVRYIVTPLPPHINWVIQNQNDS